MLTDTSPSFWRQILRNNFTRWELLAEFLQLNCEQKAQIYTQTRFSLNLPLRLAQKIEKGTLKDPILKQFLPALEELVVNPGFVSDPVGDQLSRKAPKLIHKYKGRVLLVCTSACAMNCRFCFRQNFEYEVKDKLFVEELNLIREDPSIHEVILSGGDPLSLSDSALNSLLGDICAIPHISRLRIHTRFPIGIPERIDDPFLEIISRIPIRLYFVMHSNHPQELDEEILSRLKSLQKLGVIVLNQSVLLRGVNDDVQTLVALSERLADNGILPYYLHQLDKVAGAAHFEVAEQEGVRLVQEMAKHLPGYAVPRYAREDAGAPSKTILF